MSFVLSVTNQPFMLSVIMLNVVMLNVMALIKKTVRVKAVPFVLATFVVIMSAGKSFST